MKRIFVGHCLPTVLALTLLLTGCLSRPGTERQNFALQTPALTNTAAAGTGVLAIRSCEVSPLFANRALVYRTGPNTYETDPYAGFLIPSGQALSIPVRAYLANSGLFGSVSEPDSSVLADRFLQVYVTELYGDFQKSGEPAAVLSLRVTLFESEQGRAGKHLFQKNYTQRVTLSKNTAAAVVAGWDQALGQIMGEVVNDLRTANP